MLCKSRVRFISLKTAKSKDGRDVTYGKGLGEQLLVETGEVIPEKMDLVIPGHVMELGIYDVSMDVSLSIYKDKASLKRDVQSLKLVSPQPSAASPAPQK
jgi:hypothetical protein